MSDKQLDALRLADELQSGDYYESNSVVYGWAGDNPADAAATELRRLHALCEEMGEALQHAHHVIGHPDCEMSKARAELIAKWKESK